jgi:hypothetical protein
VTNAFEKNNKIRTIVSNLLVFAHGTEDKIWLTKEECRLLEEFLTKHRSFFGLPPFEEMKDEQD